MEYMMKQKTVFTDTSHIAHLWANQLQDEARNSGNFYFNRNVIYSYGSHFPIAKHITNDKGEAAVLFTERAYSNTTAKHISVVRQAANHKDIIYCYNPESTHDQNFNSWKITAESIAKNLLKAKKPEKYLSQLAIIKGKVEIYAAFFSLIIPADLLAAITIGNKDEYASYQAKKGEYEKQAKIAAQKELQKKHKKELATWLKGKSHRLYTHNGFDYLRLSDNRIETTQAVQIPLELGKRIYQQVKDNTLQVGQNVMDYEVKEVGKLVKIGCHTFKTDYLLKFGQQIFVN